MHVLVKKEIIKWFDVTFVYPIIDSQWVRSVQYVPNKGEISMVSNAKNDLISMRLVTNW